MPKRLEIALLVLNRICHRDQELSNSRKASNPISGSKGMVILLKKWILPIGGVASVGSAPAACTADLF